MSSSRQIRVYRDLMGENERWAADTRALARDKQVCVLNLIGSPGSGKTTLLENSMNRLPDLQFAVLEGDVETTHDAERLDALGVPVCQLLSGGACHLEAKLVNRALRDLPLDRLDLVVVENVGNLVCPAEFDIGEDAKIAVLSIAEGEDKPAKYPMLFRESKAVVLTKLDLLPHLGFDLEQCRAYVDGVNGALPVFEVSAREGQGMNEWADWVSKFVTGKPE